MRGQLELDLNAVRSDDLRWQNGRSAISRNGRVEISRLHGSLVASSEAAADSDEAGHPFRSEVGRRSDLKPASLPI